MLKKAKQKIWVKVFFKIRIADDIKIKKRMGRKNN